jgi:ABC-type glycerol-3-phosphate transport system substrate-binding protein
MKKRSNVGMAVAFAAVAAVTLAGCSGGSDTAGGGGDTTLTLLVPSYSDNTKGLWEDVIDGFEKKNPSITVELEVQSWDNLNDVVTTQIQAGKAPDIMNGGPFAGFAADELLYPIEDVTSPETLDDFQKSFVDASSVDGVQYGAPLIASARALFVNNTLLSQAGVAAPPKTCSTQRSRFRRSATASPATGCPSAPRRRRPRRPHGSSAAAERSATRRRSRSTVCPRTSRQPRSCRRWSRKARPRPMPARPTGVR